MTIRNACDYIFGKFPEQIDGFRFIAQTIDLLNEASIGKSFARIATLIKNFEGAHSIKKGIEGFDIALISFRKFSADKNRQNFFQFFNEAVKWNADVLGVLKWLGSSGGVVILSQYSKSFGSLKNVCKIYSSCIAIHENSMKIYNEDLGSTKIENIALIILSCCSIWSNGANFFRLYERSAKWLEWINPWVFHGVNMVSSSAGIVKNLSKEL